MTIPQYGALIGILLAIAWAFAGFSGFLLAIVLGAVGLAVGKVITGELDLSRYTGGRDR